MRCRRCTGQRDDLPLEFEFRTRAFEVEAIGYLAICLVYGIAGFVSVKIAHNIE